MFDIGFWEIALIGVIALLVVGPERLPALARNVGMWVGRIRRYVSHVKQDIERELHAEEMRELLQNKDGLSEIRDVAEETASVLKDARNELDDAARSAQAEPDAPPAPSSEAPAARRIPQHAVDEDPFAASNLASVTPGDDSAAVPGPPPEPAADRDTLSDPDTLSEPGTTINDDEQHPERQGQR